MTAQYAVRVAALTDAPGVAALLQESYPALFAEGYAPEILAKALPLMTKANPRLLASGSFTVAETPDGRIIGCGGWTRERPGSGAVQDGEAHIRHFATHPDWVRRGIGRAILARCVNEATLAGVLRFECYSSLVAVDFYQAMGFAVVRPLDITLAPDVAIPGVLMRRELA